MAEQGRKSINSTNFSADEIRDYSERLSVRYGAKQKVITLSGLSAQSYFRAMRGGNVSTEVKDILVSAIQQVIQSFN